MSVETLLYGCLPALLALAALSLSTVVLLRTRRPGHFGLTVVVCLAVIWSLMVLGRIYLAEDRHAQTIVLFGGEHWNRLPQLTILASFLIALAQAIHALKRRRDPA